MIKKELFYEFYSSHISQNLEEIESEYRAFSKHWNEVMEYYLEKEDKPYKDLEYVQLAYLYSIIWGDYAVASLIRDRHSIENTLFATLATNISNDILAIIRLCLDGLDYQAMSIVRNLYEICLMLLNICINEEKRNEFAESARKENSYEVWRKFFNIRTMLETLSGYSYDEKLSEFWLSEYKQYYSKLSSFVHNDFANMYVYSYNKPKDEKESRALNVNAHFATRYNEILEETVGIIWIVSRIFRHIMDNENYKEFIKQILGENLIEDLRFANNACYFANDYYLKLKNIS